jgi:hypothetical protein
VVTLGAWSPAGGTELQQAGTIAYDLDNDGDTSDLLNASQNDWDHVLYDGAGSIGDPNLGASLGLKRLSPFVVMPENTASCLTAPR